MKKFTSIPPRFKEDYHSIKDDISLVSVYTTGNVIVRGRLIPDAFLTDEIRATDDYKESTPRAHRTPTLTIASPQGKKRKQNEQSYDDVDDSDNRLEPKSHKENPEHVDDDGKEEEKVDEKKDNKMGSLEARNEQMQTPIPSPTRSPREDLSFDKTISKELTTTVSPTTATTSKDSFIHKRKKRSISYKTKILPGSIAGMCRRHGQIRSHIKNKFITHEFFMSNIQDILDHCNKVVPEMTFSKTNEMIKEEMPRLVKLAVDKDREVTPINVAELISKEFATHGPKMIEELFRKHMHNTTLNLYPTKSSSTYEKLTTDLQQQLYLNMKIKPQDQAADLEFWEILKAKFEKP
ncbi:hypothetical protein Tco_0734555 [Tanacetum coccineum]